MFRVLSDLWLLKTSYRGRAAARRDLPRNDALVTAIVHHAVTLPMYSFGILRISILYHLWARNLRALHEISTSRNCFPASLAFAGIQDAGRRCWWIFAVHHGGTIHVRVDGQPLELVV